MKLDLGAGPVSPAGFTPLGYVNGTLIYPAPEPGHGGLGTHLTLDMGGRIKFGPDVEWVDSPDDLTLKRRVERLERTLLREALHRADGNQTQAARLLGLSRFGLQKKLRRYELG